MWFILAGDAIKNKKWEELVRPIPHVPPTDYQERTVLTTYMERKNE